MAEITTPTPLTSVPKSNKVRQILKWVGFFLGGLFLLIVAYVAFMLIKMNYLPKSVTLWLSPEKYQTSNQQET